MIDALPRQLDRLQHAIGDVGEPKGVPVDEQELLLEPDRERLALPKAVLRRCAALAQGLSPSAARAAIRPNTSAAASPLA